MDATLEEKQAAFWDSLPLWDNDTDFTTIRKAKKSTIKNNKPTHHYGSKGYCYSFGLRNDYSKIADDKLSVANYAGDEDASMTTYIHYIAKQLAMCHKSFDKVIPSMSSYINLTCRSFKYEAKNTILENYLSTFTDSTCGKQLCSISTANININATTADIHCEKDTTYTIICVPLQKNNNARITFEFYINQETTLQLDVKQNGVFTYSAYCLAHRQLSTFGTNCMNISTYSAKSVYNHFRKSLDRVQKKK